MSTNSRFSRRQFLKRTALAGAGITLLPNMAFPYSQSPAGIRKFLVGLPALGPGGANNVGNYIPVLTPDTQKHKGTDYYEVVAKQFTQQLHPDIPPTTFWGYADARTLDSKYLGGIIVAKRRRPVKLKMINQLPGQHILPVDPTQLENNIINETRPDRIAVHLHGGLVHWTSDGGPFAWYSNAKGFLHGSSFLNGAEPGAGIYNYPNDQSSRFLWYHDHAHGITRLNAYAGLATAYLITDDAEADLVRRQILPDIGGAFPLGIPLVIQDKTFWDGGVTGTDPFYNQAAPGAMAGSLWYPHIYEGPELPSMLFSDPNLNSSGHGRWDHEGSATPPISAVPEFFSDTMLVNGVPFPVLPVDRRRYRFRLLNGSQARFFNLMLYKADGSADGITLAASHTEVDPNGNPLQIPTNASGPRMIQIGNECGFLLQPVVLNDPPIPLGLKTTSHFGPNDPTLGNVNRYNLLLAPAERADIIVDFRDVAPGSEIILYNDAPAPFPCGDIRNDYYTGRPDLCSIGGAPANVPGQGPDTRIIMKFKVGSKTVSELNFNNTHNTLKLALPVAFALTQPSLLISPRTPAKVKTLNEDFDEYGRLRQLIGAPNPAMYVSTPTEVAEDGEVQRWQIFNFTGDTHPMHFHLVNVAVRKQEQWAFATNSDGETIPLLNAHGMPFAIPNTAHGPDGNEAGWKETVRMNPGEVVTVDMKFDLPPGNAPFSPRLLASYGVKGYEYVWHCHILEHEEHDMMHAMIVTPVRGQGHREDR